MSRSEQEEARRKYRSATCHQSIELIIFPGCRASTGARIGLLFKPLVSFLANRSSEPMLQRPGQCWPSQIHQDARQRIQGDWEDSGVLRGTMMSAS